MRKEIRAVIDTNIIISAAIGKSAVFLAMYNAFVDCAFTPISSPLLQEEILNAIKKPRLRRYFRAEEMKRFKELIRTDAILVIPTKKLALCRDPKDNILLEAALEGDADFIVTSDKDLLVLKSCAGIPIVTTRQFLKTIINP